MESSKEDKNINAKVAEVAAGVEKLAVSKKKKLKFVKVNPNEINIVITDGRGREPEVKKEPHKVSNQFHSKQGQDSNRKSSNYNVDFNRNANSNRSSNSTSAPTTSTSRNMARGGGKHSSGSSNYKADFEKFLSLGVETKKINDTLVYPLKTIDCNFDEMTSREFFEDIYADPRHHQFLYKDRTYIKFFQKCILTNEEMFKDKVVLDVGCGLGLFSLFAAKAGAKRVISVDCSVITQITEKIVSLNGFSDIITVVRSRMEDITTLPHDIKKVDIIISSWMGHCLYLDSVFNAVIYARDRFLKKSGHIIPDKAELCCVIAYDRVTADRNMFWYDVYEYNMDPIRRDQASTARHQSILSDSVMSDEEIVLHTINLRTCKVADTNFKQTFKITTNKAGFINVLALYFRAYSLGDTVVLDTSPDGKGTHWGQTLLFLDTHLMVSIDQELTFDFFFTRQQDKTNSIQCKLALHYAGSYYSQFYDKKYLLYI